MPSTNSAPVIISDFLGLVELDSINNIIDLHSIVSDADGDALITASISSSNAIVSINTDNTFDYTPNPGFYGWDTVIFMVEDINGATLNASANIYVDDMFQVVGIDSAGTVIDLHPVFNDSVFVYDVFSENATVSIDANGDVNYVPNAGFRGYDVISYDAIDASGGFFVEAITVNVQPLNVTTDDQSLETVATGWGWWDIIKKWVVNPPVNETPVANQDSVSVYEDSQSNIIEVLDNDTDANGDKLIVTQASVENGTVSISADKTTLIYTPAVDDNTQPYQPPPPPGIFPVPLPLSPEIISYTISDSKTNGTASSTVSVEINAINDAPVATDFSLSINEDIATQIDFLSHVTDVDSPIDLISATAFHGSVDLLSGIYTPNTDYNGSDTISYKVKDVYGLESSAKATITIKPVNDAPVATDFNVSINNLDTLKVDFLAHVTDVDSVNITVVSTSALTGSITNDGDYFSNFITGQDSITYKVSDGLNTSTATVSVDVYEGGIPLPDPVIPAPTPIVSDSQITVNTETEYTQSYSSTSVLSDGSYVVVWRGASTHDEDDSSWGVFAQHFDQYGVRQGSEFLVNTTTNQAQTLPSVAATFNGGFVVVWQSDNDTSAEYQYDIYAQVFDSSAQKVGEEILVNTTTVDEQSYAVVSSNTPYSSYSNQDGFVVAWQSSNQDGDGWGIYSQVFDFTGNKIGDETLVNTITTSDQKEPSITPILINQSVYSEAGYLVTWHSYNQDGSSWGVYGQKFLASGEKYADPKWPDIAPPDEFLINSYVEGQQAFPDVASFNNGNEFVVTWTSTSKENGVDVYAKHYSNYLFSDVEVSEEFLVNTESVGNQQHPKVVFLESGDYVIVYESITLNDTYEIILQRFNRFDNSKVGAEKVISVGVETSNYGVDITSMNDGGYLVTWHGLTAENSWDILGQRFDENNNPIDGVIIEPIVNTAPEAFDDTATVDEDATIDNINVLGNDKDAQDDLITIKSVSSNDGTVTINTDNTLKFVPKDNFNGDAIIKYIASDGNLDSNEATVTVTVNPVNDAPTGSVTITGTVQSGQVLTADNDLKDDDGMGTVTYTWLADGVVIAGASSSTYTLTSGEVGKSISVKAIYTDDGNTPESKSSAATAKVEANTISVGHLIGTDLSDTVTSTEGANLIQTKGSSDFITLVADGVWSSTHMAKNVGNNDNIGTHNLVSLAGKNKFSDVIDGGLDMDTINLTAGDDAFFLEDVYSELHKNAVSTTTNQNIDSAARIVNIESINAGGGNNIIDMTSTNFIFQNDASSLTVFTGAGNDIIWGSNLKDFIYAGNGDDIIFGGSGSDTLIGEGGKDTFQFTSTAGDDIISDFNITDDKIELYYQSTDAHANTDLILTNGVLTWNANATNNVTIDLSATLTSSSVADIDQLVTFVEIV